LRKVSGLVLVWTNVLLTSVDYVHHRYYNFQVKNKIKPLKTRLNGKSFTAKH